MEDYKEMLEEMKRINLCTYFILPLAGLTKNSFGEGILLNTYVEKKKLWIIVHCVDLELVSYHLKFSASRYWQTELGAFLAYLIPEKYTYDVHMFNQGKYSWMTEEVKDIIRERSGLAYKEGRRNDFRLLALENAYTFRNWLMSQFSIDDLPDELLDQPAPSSFMEVDL